ncbi:hypothetical protein ACFSQZ_11120 [Rubritalea spongiae]|uniref:Uncharacterized protein n=2 Tax=Rubritalea spongiae TaxID=430797 RepID=A0ABW5E309_9BACT
MKWIGILLCALLVNCASNTEGEKEEVKAVEPESSWKKSPVAWVNGAEVYSEVEPLYGKGAIEKSKLVYRAGTANFDGPFNWKFVAEGDPSVHRNLRVDAVQITTEKTSRKVNVPQLMLGGKRPFAYEEIKKKRGFSFKKEKIEDEMQPRWMAEVEIPTTLQVYPKADGKVVVAAKISVETEKGMVSEWVNFALLPNANTSGSFTFRQTMVEYDGIPID